MGFVLRVEDDVEGKGWVGCKIVGCDAEVLGGLQEPGFRVG